MRESYREDLDGVVTDLVGMTERVRTAVRLSTKALLEADLAIAEQVIRSRADRNRVVAITAFGLIVTTATADLVVSRAAV